MTNSPKVIETKSCNTHYVLEDESGTFCNTKRLPKGDILGRVGEQHRDENGELWTVHTPVCHKCTGVASENRARR